MMLLIYSGYYCTVRSISCTGERSYRLPDQCKRLINETLKTNFGKLINVSLNYSDDDLCKIAEVLKNRTLKKLNAQNCFHVFPGIITTSKSYFSSLRLLFTTLRSEYVKQRNVVELKTANVTDKQANRSGTIPKVESDDPSSIKDCADNKVDYMLGMVAYCLSIVCLCGMLLTYVLFTELRTTAGKNVMVLALFLVITCILHMLNLILGTNRIICISVALGLQWAYLNVFLLTFSIATDIYKTFGRQNLRAKLKSEKHLSLIWLVCLLLSSVDVGICVALKFATNGIEITFTKGTCFIAGLYANFLYALSLLQMQHYWQLHHIG